MDSKLFDLINKTLQRIYIAIMLSYFDKEPFYSYLHRVYGISFKRGTSANRSVDR